MMLLKNLSLLRRLGALLEIVIVYRKNMKQLSSFSIELFNSTLTLLMHTLSVVMNM